MRKIVILSLVLVLLYTGIAAQGPVIWLPLLTKGYNECEDTEMSDWKIIVPESTTNMVLNPSGEIVGNFAAVGGGGAAMARSSTYNRFGLYSYRIQTTGDDEGGSVTLSALTNAIHYVTLHVRGTLPTAWDWSLDNANYHAPSSVEAIDSNWTVYGYQFPANEANGSTTLYIRQNGAGSGDFYVDGIQAEAKSYWTTYVDGEQQGCSWSGTEHASTSSRSAQTRAGGRVYDLEDDLYFDIGGMSGLGTAPQTVIFDEYALLPGGELNTIKIHPRPFTLTGVVRGTSMSNLHTKLAALQSAVLPNSYPQDENGWQPVRLRYTGSTVHKEVAAHYEGGLEGSLEASGPCYWQKSALRFIADDPYFYPYGGTGTGGAGEAAVLDTNDSATFQTVAAKLRSTGQWDDLGSPDALGTYIYVSALARGNDATVFIGGDFDNFDNIAAADNIVQFNPSTEAFAALTTGANDSVIALAVGADGTLYVGGYFTSAGGVANTFQIASWSGSAWSALGAGLDNNVFTLAIGLDGTLYAGGDFTDVQGGPGGTYNRIVAWSGAAYSALGTGLNGRVRSIAVAPDGSLYVGGEFTTAGGGAANYIAKWDGSSWSALGSGMNGNVHSVAVDRRGIVFAGGAFTTAGGVTVNYMAKWNGTAWTALGGGMNNTVDRIAVGPDGILYAGGLFTTAGSITLSERAAKWNGASWAHLGVDLPGGITEATAWMLDNTDPVVEANYDIYAGFAGTGTAYYPGTATVTNNGTADVYPVFVFARSGGTTAELQTIRNETTGKELLFDYDLLDGETLTIDLRPTQKSIISSLFGSRPDAILVNSDFGEFTLQPGDNDITSFVNVAGAPTITAYIQWQAAYRGLD